MGKYSTVAEFRSQTSIPLDDPRIAGVKPRFEDDPKKGFRSPREFFSAIGKHAFDLPTASAKDARLRFLAAAGSDEQSTFSDSYGGFLLPEAFGTSGDLLHAVEADPFAGRTTPIPMQATEVHIGYRVDKDHSTSVSGGLLVSRREESAEVVASRLKIGRFTLYAKSLFGMTYSTEELLTDSPASVIAVLENGYRDEFGTALLKERLNGTGVGELLGIDKSAATIEIPKESAQTAATITGANLSKMMARCWRYNSAFWLANQDCTAQLLAATTATGAPCLTPSASGETAYDCLGRPLYFSEHTETLGTAGDIVLVNPAEYVEGIYQPLQSAESIHVRFVNHECAFKFWMRGDGAPWWDSPLTPENGTATLSPFVRLATRA